MAPPLFYVKITVKPHWGFLLTQVGTTKSRAALRVIPPTTLIGALAYSLLAGYGPEEIPIEGGQERGTFASSADGIREILVSVNARIEAPLVRYADLSKIVFFDVREGVIRSDAVAVEKIYTPTGSVKIVFIVDPSSAEKLLGSGWKREIIAATASISRIGSKESIVSVSDVEYGEAEPVTDSEVVTGYYFPFTAAHPAKGTFIVVSVVDWTKARISDYLDAAKVQLVVPYNSTTYKPTLVKARLRSSASAFDVGGEMVVAWR